MIPRITTPSCFTESVHLHGLSTVRAQLVPLYLSVHPFKMMRPNHLLILA
jgi:hypothetical protein